MGKFKKVDVKKQKGRILNRAKGAIKNLNDKQKLMAFSVAWNGSPFEAKGKLGKAAIAKANFAAPGKIYKQMFDDLEALLKKEIDKAGLKRLRKNLLKKAYSFNKLARVGKHLTNEQVEEYKEMGSEIKKVLKRAEKKKLGPKDFEWVSQVLLADLKQSEEREKQKMMQSFGLLPKNK